MRDKSVEAARNWVWKAAYGLWMKDSDGVLVLNRRNRKVDDPPLVDLIREAKQLGHEEWIEILGSKKHRLCLRLLPAGRVEWESLVRVSEYSKVVKRDHD